MPAYDLELLLRDVKGIEVNWYEQYSNPPRITLLTTGDNDFPYFKGPRTDGVIFNLYEELPLFSGKIYYSEHPMGWVKYFSHCGDPAVNEGGFGGSPFGVVLKDGTQKVLKGPWSSRAECVNIAVNQDPEKQVVDITVKGRHLIGTAIKQQALIALMKHFKFSHYFIQRDSSLLEKEPPAVSMRGDSYVKESGKSFRDHARDPGKLNILYSPE